MICVCQSWVSGIIEVVHDGIICLGTGIIVESSDDIIRSSDGIFRSVLALFGDIIGLGLVMDIAGCMRIGKE